MPTTIQRKQYAYQICERHKAVKGNIHYTTEVDDGPDIAWKLIQWNFRERNVKTDLFSGEKKYPLVQDTESLIYLQQVQKRVGNVSL